MPIKKTTRHSSTREERAKYVHSVLRKLYPDPKPALDFSNHFTLLVSVLMSAQTTDARVNIVTPALFALADSPEKMARLSAVEILSLIKTCGLAPTKAKNIRALSDILVRDFGGQVPDNFEDLESLPGVGHKTASVVMAQGFGIPAFPVDTHIHRLAKRWRLSVGKNVEQVEQDLKKLFPKSSWNKLHLQIIYYGREHCTARGCDGTICRICAHLNN